MTDRAREHEARNAIWRNSGSGSNDAIWVEYAKEMAARRGIPIHEALELILPEVEPEPTRPYYWERVCIVCGVESEWWRTTTSFNVYYGFCEKHARKESDFEPDESLSTTWFRPLY